VLTMTAVQPERLEKWWRRRSGGPYRVAICHYAPLGEDGHEGSLCGVVVSGLRVLDEEMANADLRKNIKFCRRCRWILGTYPAWRPIETATPSVGNVLLRRVTEGSELWVCTGMWQSNVSAWVRTKHDSRYYGILEPTHWAHWPAPGYRSRIANPRACRVQSEF